jgi:hypothetical protein
MFIVPGDQEGPPRISLPGVKLKFSSKEDRRGVREGVALEREARTEPRWGVVLVPWKG